MLSGIFILDLLESHSPPSHLSPRNCSHSSLCNRKPTVSSHSEQTNMSDSRRQNPLSSRNIVRGISLWWVYQVWEAMLLDKQQCKIKLSGRESLYQDHIFQISCSPSNLNVFDDIQLKKCSKKEETLHYYKFTGNSLTARNCGCLEPCTNIRYQFKVINLWSFHQKFNSV